MTELRALLRAANVPPPYLMAGHSLGGLNARLYASKFRDEVAGRLLVDASSEYVDRSNVPIEGVSALDREKCRDFLQLAESCNHNPMTSPEGIDRASSFAQLRSVGPGALRGLPLYFVVRAVQRLLETARQVPSDAH